MNFHKMLFHCNKFSVHLYGDFQIRRWIESPNIYPRSECLSIGWITVAWRINQFDDRHVRRIK